MRPTSRREFVQGIGGAGLALVVGCGRPPWQAQRPTQVPRIGYLGLRPIPVLAEAFRQGLGDLGYVEGQNIAVDWRFAEHGGDARPEVAAELVEMPVDVILAENTVTASIARQVTSTIPIVVALGDPVTAGLATSLARPGANVTGLSHYPTQLSAKRLELLKETVPTLARLAVLWNPSSLIKQVEWAETQRAARTLDIQVQSLEVGGADELDDAFVAATREQADAALVFGDNLTGSHAAQIVALAARSRLPTMYESRPFIDAGGLIAYGPNFPALLRRSAYYVHRILDGAKPADLPIEQPTKFDFVINLQTARALGLTIPPQVLAQATEVLQ
jgi:putative ABC transport system substrate-binding protein